MRLQLSGYGGALFPTTQSLSNGVPFLKADYVALGYTHFDVICIGASGGRGGEVYLPSIRRVTGGGGGGGGIHRVKGLLSTLPSSCSVVVGAPGTNGSRRVNYADSFTPATDGGVSSFNGTTCRASGGKAGQDAPTATTPYYGGAGGDGGVGNRTIAGGGAIGSVNGVGQDGTWNGTIGQGGAGGSGAFKDLAIFPSSPTRLPRAGGRGAYSVSDLSVYSPFGPVDNSNGSGLDADAGWGGGAKSTPITSIPVLWGTRVEYNSGNGLVTLRLYVE